MRVVIQLVKESSVQVNNSIIGRIGRGLMVLVGFEEADTMEDIQWISRKLLNMRIFPDEEGKMNLSVKDVSGEILIVSQFTLHASTKKGNRPSFIYAAPPDKARNLYNTFLKHLKSTTSIPISTGEFGAMMEVSLINDGPVTITMDSKNKQ